MFIATPSRSDFSFTVHERRYAFSMAYDEKYKPDADTIRQFQKHGCASPELVHAMERIIRPGDTVIDGGANIGFFTLIMSQLVGPQGKVYAVEPGKNNLAKLEENLKINRVENVEVVPKALWDVKGKTKFFLHPDGGLNSIMRGPEHRGWEYVETITLSAFPLCRFLKLDIEGAEFRALHGMTDLPPYIMSEVNYEALAEFGVRPGNLLAYMGKRGKDTFLPRGDGLLPVLLPPNCGIITRVLDLNLLFATILDVGKVWKEVRI